MTALFVVWAALALPCALFALAACKVAADADRQAERLSAMDRFEAIERLRLTREADAAPWIG